MVNPYLLVAFWLLAVIVLTYVYLNALWWAVENKRRWCFFGLILLNASLLIFSDVIMKTGWMLTAYIFIDIGVSFLSSIAIWRAVNKKHRWWFFGIVILPITGILPLFYLYKINRPSKDDKLYE